ncbi:hypothetical protein Si105_01819 [Streptococcus infantarius subsp. infantarius]|jgi:hypothetical protein|uniref:Uncharacterized protein n=2 Tax=Streptococcus TaxID=1301 RepID=A0A380KPY7_9STRE|nr:hypothetical protein [Streptococcus infantarius subsp. infantarius]SDO92456.1 hypothetical protein SAMN05216347_103116 [Streptococcus equinus]SUN69268.1 Uncharacterised protein [Streptococcus infantarius]MCO4472294.1 hypothetical protein [Streptococcus infantarius subsp. infantarius]MCO4479714.1 hypothetical protein [Streptococcus infantarius subsp. infantarius]
MFTLKKTAKQLVNYALIGPAVLLPIIFMF